MKTSLASSINYLWFNYILSCSDYIPLDITLSVNNVLDAMSEEAVGAKIKVFLYLQKLRDTVTKICRDSWSQTEIWSSNLQNSKQKYCPLHDEIPRNRLL